MRQPVSHYDADAERDPGFELVGDERADERPPRDRRLPAIVLTVVAMAVFAGGLWFAYVQGARHATPAKGGEGVPVVRADERPTKVKPDQPGGMKVPDQNVSLYGDKPGQQAVERLLPPPEQPLPRPVPPPKPAPTVAVPAAPAAPAAPPPEAAVQPPPANAPAAAEPRPAVPAKAAAAPRKAAAPAPAPAPVPGSGKVQVRLGSLRSPEAAREEWSRLKRENADLLGSLTANAVAVDLGEKGIYYRIVAGPFADAAAAERLCSEMKRRNRGCILAR